MILAMAMLPFRACRYLGCWALQQATMPIIDLTPFTLQTLETLVISNVISIPNENDNMMCMTVNVV